MENKPPMSQQELEQVKILTQVGNFSLNILHDLINPITGLSLYLESIKDQKIREILLPISKTNNQIIEFIKTIQETVENPNKVSFVSIDKIVKSSILLNYNRAKKEKIYLIFGRNISGLQIKINKFEMYQIILNLIGNSIDSFKDFDLHKYKNIRKFVTISFSENKDSYRLSVIDNGCGIKKSILNKIFDKNFTTKSTGFGIGLTTVKKIVTEKLRGEIKVQSIWKQGSKFHIYIPKRITRT